MPTADPTPGNAAGNTGGKKPSLAKVLIPVAMIIALVVGGLWVLRGHVKHTVLNSPGNGTDGPPMAAEIRVGATLPDFPLRTFKGGEDVPASSLKGKVVLVNFWATWCEPCMVEMPSLVKVYEAYKARGFDIAAVNVDTNPEAVLPRTIQKYGISFPVYLDAEGSLADLFQVQSIPLTVVMDGQRKILMIEQEGIDWNGADFRSALEKWLAG